MGNYRKEAHEDAIEAITNFAPEILAQLREKGEASDDNNNDYEDGDSFWHESFVDRYYDLTEAALLLDDLSDYEETDSGLWEGQAPREAIGTQAAFTYGQAVWEMWSEMIKNINEEWGGMKAKEKKAANEEWVIECAKCNS